MINVAGRAPFPLIGCVLFGVRFPAIFILG